MTWFTQAEDALLRSASLLVAPRTADGRIKPVPIDALAQGHRLHQAGVLVSAVTERSDSLLDRVEILGDPQVQSELRSPSITELDHLAELPAGVDVHQRERNRGRRKGLDRQMQENRRVLADAVEQHRILEGGCGLTIDVDRLGLELVQDSVVGHGPMAHGGRLGRSGHS